MMQIKRQQQGAVLIATLFTALLMAVFIMGFIGLTTVDAHVASHAVESLQAYYVAEAGVADAVAYIRTNGLVDYSPAPVTYPLGSSDQYQVTFDSSSKVISSSGQTSPLGLTRALEVTVSVSGSSAPYTVNVQQWKEVGP